MYHMSRDISWSYYFSLCIPLQLHSIRMRQILPFAHARPTMPCILLVGASVSEPTLVVCLYTFACHTAIFFLCVISNFYACAIMSSWPDVRVYVYIPRYLYMCVCLIDEEAHGVFGSCRRGREATVEATCRKATGETAERREEILSRKRVRYCQRVTERRVTETATEREARLARRRVQDRARRASESLKQRDARLQQLRGSQQQRRIASESTEEREAHLQQLRVSQQQRFASADRRRRGPSSASAGQQQRIAEGSTDLREARLHRLRVNQQHRLAFQCPEETEARRAHDRQNHMPMDTADVPLFHQPRALSKMVQFHSRLASLQILKCITCLERFLGITVSFLLYLCIPLQLHSIRMRQILPFAHGRPTMPCILLV